MTPDAHAAAMGVTAYYLFWRWLSRTTVSETIFVGSVLGLAELTKFTLLVFYPLWIVTWILFRYWEHQPRNTKFWLHDGTKLLGMMCVSVVVINLFYGLEGTFRPIGQYYFRSQMFSGVESKPDGSQTIGNRFAGSWVESLPVPLPVNYLQGIDTQRSDFEQKMWSYLNGEWRFGGWWYYYLYALAVKLPLGTWWLVTLAIGVSVWGRGYSTSLRGEMVVLLPFLVIFGFVSSQTGFSIHSRYLIPALPFLFVWISKVARVFEMHPYTRKRLMMKAAVVLALTWSVGSSLWYFPHDISYFNELAGGPTGGHTHLLDSNIAWGQDLFFLKQWLEKHPEAKPLHLASYGLIDPRLAGIEFTLPPIGPVFQTQDANASSSQTGPLPGWHIVDVNHLRGAKLVASDGKGGWQAVARNGYDFTYFQQFQPVAMAGYSIYIYHITIDDANRVRRQLGLEELK